MNLADIFKTAPSGIRKNGNRCRAAYRFKADSEIKECGGNIFELNGRRMPCPDCETRAEALVERLGRWWSWQEPQMEQAVRAGWLNKQIEISGFNVQVIRDRIEKDYGDIRKKNVEKAEEDRVKKQQEESLKRSW